LAYPLSLLIAATVFLHEIKYEEAVKAREEQHAKYLNDREASVWNSMNE